MPTPRTCPHCQTVIPADRGFFFDEKMNLICGNCKQVAFPATEEAERMFPRRYNQQPHPVIPPAYLPKVAGKFGILNNDPPDDPPDDPDEG